MTALRRRPMGAGAETTALTSVSFYPPQQYPTPPINNNPMFWDPKVQGRCVLVPRSQTAAAPRLDLLPTAHPRWEGHGSLGPAAKSTRPPTIIPRSSEALRDKNPWRRRWHDVQCCVTVMCRAARTAALAATAAARPAPLPLLPPLLTALLPPPPTPRRAAPRRLSGSSGPSPRQPGGAEAGRAGAWRDGTGDGCVCGGGITPSPHDTSWPSCPGGRVWAALAPVRGFAMGREDVVALQARGDEGWEGLKGPNRNRERASRANALPH